MQDCTPKLHQIGYWVKCSSGVTCRSASIFTTLTLMFTFICRFCIYVYLQALMFILIPLQFFVCTYGYQRGRRQAPVGRELLIYSCPETPCCLRIMVTAMIAMITKRTIARSNSNSENNRYSDNSPNNEKQGSGC